MQQSAKHGNNYDALRLIASFMVLASHQFALSGRPEPIVFAGSTLGKLGVAIFFSISGFLIAASWKRDPHIWPFAVKRLLRIWPAFAVCLVIVASVAAALMPERWRDAWDFFSWSLIFGRQDGGFFPGQPYDQLNGSIWTIRIEMSCYALLVGLALVFRRYLSITLAAVIAAFIFYLMISTEPSIQRILRFHSFSGPLYTPWYIAIFLIGSAYQFINWLRARAVWIAIAGIAMIVAGRGTLGLALLTPVVVIIIGESSWPILRSFGRFGDLSYGLYLWAWPVQQTVTWILGKETNIFVLILVSSVATLTLAFASWHLIEKRALRWKSDLGLSTAASRIDSRLNH